MITVCLALLVSNTFIITFQLTKIIDYLNGEKQNDTD